jgi:predicted Zn-dependent protease
MVNNEHIASLLAEGIGLCESSWNDQSKWKENHSAAIALFERVLILEPGNVAALTNLGAALSNVGKHRKALKILEQAESTGSQDRNLYFNLAVAMMNFDAHTRNQANQFFLRASSMESRGDTMEAYFDPQAH